MEGIVESILRSMSSVKKPQAIFMMTLFSVLVSFQGKATFRNLSRYCDYSEKAFSRWYRRDFEFLRFNKMLYESEFGLVGERVAAIDASFMGKSGKSTEGLGWFYHGGAQKTERGLEMSTICVVDLKSNTAYALDNQQTIDTAPTGSKQEKDETRVDHYAQQVIRVSDDLKSLGIEYLACDSYYSKIKFVDAVTQTGLHCVGKLRNDANLKWLYEGTYSGSGRPRKYDGKIKVRESLERFFFEGTLEDNVEVYSKVVYSVGLKREIRLVVLKWDRNDKIGTALLYATDTELSAMKVVAYYKARFQIEFLFRDAKQYTGLMDCQSCSKQAIHMQINASMTTLNLLKIEDRRSKNCTDKTVISIASWRRKKMNQNLIKKVFVKLDIDPNSRKVESIYKELSSYGTIAA